MNINLILTANNKLLPGDEESELKLKKLKVGEFYSCDIKLNQNYKLHSKIFGFFAFCCDHYFGDIDAHKDKYKLKYVKDKLTIISGYYTQVYSRDGTSFELIANSISYENLEPEDRGIFYKKIVDSALKRVFDNTTDELILNKLITWF